MKAKQFLGITCLFFSGPEQSRNAHFTQIIRKSRLMQVRSKRITQGGHTVRDMYVCPDLAVRILNHPSAPRECVHEFLPSGLDVLELPPLAVMREPQQLQREGCLVLEHDLAGVLALQ